ncbi:MAG: zinc-dependent metalloprotease [Candidatus Polarisedimenticolia bacterium]
MRKRIALVSWLIAGLILSGAPAWPQSAPADPAIAAKDSEGQEQSRWKKKKKDKEADKKAAADQKAGPKKEEPTFEDTTKDHQKIEGFFTLWTKDGRYLMELKPDQMDKPFMVSITRSSGIGQSFLLAAQVLGENPVEFRKVGKKVQAIMKNPRFQAMDDPDIKRAVDKSFSESLIGSAKIESAPHPESKSILVDVGSFFLTDVEGVGAFLGQVNQTPYNVDRENSYVSAAHGFPMNTEIEARVHFVSQKPANFVNLPDSRSMFIDYTYSLSQIPQAADYIPRLADDRVGHFFAMYQDFSDDKRETPYVRYVTRWNLQKEEPYAPLSKPKEPITFWLENNIPKQYRKAVADGILVWNHAFEKIGFKDAIVVKQQPDDADWDPADVRYATVRWFVTTTGSFAIGPSRINPVTGQIFDADIGVAESIVRLARREYQEMVDPVGMIQSLARSMEPSLMEPQGPALFGRRDPRFLCNLSSGATLQAGFGLSLAAARGMVPGSVDEDKYVNDFITHVMAHEVGHTLGLRHNFRASYVLGVKDLQNTAMTTDRGLTGSVMDYIPVNLAANGQKQGQYWQTTLGAYDEWAIEYAYKPIPNVKKPEDELTDLRRIASRVADGTLLYGTDEDMTEPRSSMWDIGSSGIAFYKERVSLATELWDRIPQTFNQPGEGYQAMRRSFQEGLFQFVPAVINVPKFIGGLYAHRDHVGDPQGRLPFAPVPADQQREALDFLRAAVFSSDSFKLSPDLLNRLAANRWWDFSYSVFSMPRMEFPLHDTVLAMQQIALQQLYNPVRLDRLVDLEMQFPAGQKPFTMAEMFDGLKSSIWSEVYQTGAPRIDSFRRALQRDHLMRLTRLVVSPSPDTPEDATTLARANLTEIRSRLDAALKAGQGDAATRAHLDESRQRIDAALSAQMIRLTS